MLRNKSRMIIAVAVMLAPLFLQGVNTYAWQFAAVGDIECNDIGKRVADGMKATDAEIHILLGDIGYGEEQCVFYYFKELGVKILAACRNHDDCAAHTQFLFFQLTSVLACKKSIFNNSKY